MKPITELKKLLGFSTIKETAEFFGIPLGTANGLNSGQGSKNLQKAYKNLCRVLKLISADERRAIFEPLPAKELSLAQKYQKCDALKKKLIDLPAQTQKSFEEALDFLNEYVGTQIEYERLRKL